MKMTCKRAGPSAEIRRLWTVFAAGMAIAAVEFFGGLLSHSLALASDAGHVLMDNASIGLALFVAYRAAKATPERVALMRHRGANLLALSLGGIGLWIIAEAVRRWGDARPIFTPVMTGVSLFGAICNYFQHRTLHGAHDHEKHRMHRLLDQHILSDLFQSLAVLAGGIAIWATGYRRLDPLLSLGIGALMIWWMIQGLRGRGHDHSHDHSHDCCPDGHCASLPDD